MNGNSEMELPAVRLHRLVRILQRMARNHRYRGIRHSLPNTFQMETLECLTLQSPVVDIKETFQFIQSY